MDINKTFSLTFTSGKSDLFPHNTLNSFDISLPLQFNTENYEVNLQKIIIPTTVQFGKKIWIKVTVGGVLHIESFMITPNDTFDKIEKRIHSFLQLIDEDLDFMSTYLDNVRYLMLKNLTDVPILISFSDRFRELYPTLEEEDYNLSYGEFINLGRKEDFEFDNFFSGIVANDFESSVIFTCDIIKPNLYKERWISYMDTFSLEKTYFIPKNDTFFEITNIVRPIIHCEILDIDGNEFPLKLLNFAEEFIITLFFRKRQ